MPAPDYKDAEFVSKYSRSTRRMIERGRLFLDMRKIQNRIYIDRLLFAGLTPAQRREKHARISGLGRIAVFGLRYWGNRLQRRARLTCVDQGWWCMPSASAVAGGVWEVQLPPN